MIKSDSPVSMHGHRYKVSNIICSLICWLLPWVPVGIVLGSETTPYAVMNMRFCYPKGSLTGFFTTTFISELAQGIGCTCLLFVVYKLYLVSLLLVFCFAIFESAVFATSKKNIEVINIIVNLQKFCPFYEIKETYL